MLFPSEAHETEIVGSYEVVNPLAAAMIAEAKRMDARKRREVKRAGLTMHQAIERALRQRPGVRARGAAASQPPTVGRTSG